LNSEIKNVDIKFLEKPPSKLLKIERLENKIINSFGRNKTKGPK
jgi:hypothetical protein